VAAFVRQVECVSCSNSRSFVHHHNNGRRVIGQAEALALGKRALLTCGRCGSASLLLSWAEALPDAAIGIVPSRRRADPSTPVPVARASVKGRLPESDRDGTA
jgi:hypothetical protein